MTEEYKKKICALLENIKNEEYLIKIYSFAKVFADDKN